MGGITAGPDLAHARVVSFVSIQPLVDLLSQFRILLRAPKRQECNTALSDQLISLAKLISMYLMQDSYTCGSGLRGIP